MQHRNKKKLAFSLVELSAVLVVIGVIIAGISYARSIMKQANVVAAVQEFGNIQTMIANFHNIYNALPGDLNTASSYWGTSCAAVVANCNGNLNGLIDNSGVSNPNEVFMAWMHLYLAKLSPTAVTGTGNGTGVQADMIGSAINIPKSRIPNGGYYLSSEWSFPYNFFGLSGGVNSATVPGHIWNWIVFGAKYANLYPLSPVLTTTEAYSIDLKLDDGMAGLGNIIGMQGAGYTCVNNGGDNTTATYATSSQGVQCALFYRVADFY